MEESEDCYVDVDVYFDVDVDIDQNQKTKKEKEENIWSRHKKKNGVLTNQLTNRANIEQSAFLKVRK